MKLSFQVLLIVTLTPLFYWFLTHQVILCAVVDGHSMEPTYHNTDVVAMTKVKLWFHNPRKGDVVLIREYNGFGRGDGKIDIKRVAAVTNNNYFVLGDNTNKGASFDSRFYGALPRNQIIAVAWK
jgi:signal peptidase I